MNKPILSIVGPNKSQSSPLHERRARDAGRMAVELGFRVMTGGEEGVMRAAFVGAKTAKNYASGDTIALCDRDDPDKGCLADIIICTGLGHARNFIMAHGDAVLAIGGGAGTMTEIAFAWGQNRPVLAFSGKGSAGLLAGKRLDTRRSDRVIAINSEADLRRHLSRLGKQLARGSTKRARK